MASNYYPRYNYLTLTTDAKWCAYLDLESVSLTYLKKYLYWQKPENNWTIHEKYSVSSTFLYNGNSKYYVVRILYAILFQWSKCFGYRGQQIYFETDYHWQQMLAIYAVIFGMQIYAKWCAYLDLESVSLTYLKKYLYWQKPENNWTVIQFSPLTFFFHFIYFLDFKFMSDLKDLVSFQSMKIEFDIFNREFFRTLTFSLKFQKKAHVSIICMKDIVFLLRIIVLLHNT
jgi:hypothetical protein